MDREYFKKEYDKSPEPMQADLLKLSIEGAGPAVVGGAYPGDEINIADPLEGSSIYDSSYPPKPLLTGSGGAMIIPTQEYLGAGGPPQED